jgi:hypothetical protein
MTERTHRKACKGHITASLVVYLVGAVAAFGAGDAQAGACKGTVRQLDVIQLSGSSNARSQTVVRNLSANTAYDVVISSNDQEKNSALLSPGADVSKLWSVPDKDTVEVTLTPVGETDATVCIYRVVFGSYETRWNPGPSGADNLLCAGAVTVSCDKSYNSRKLRWNTTFTIEE